MVRFRVLPYKSYSNSAKSLADELHGKRLRLEGSTFVPRNTDVIVNWGNTNTWAVHWSGGYPKTILNLPNQIRNASDKLSFFNMMKEKDYVPKFWTDPENIPDEAFPVVCRKVLNGHSGAGIVIASDRDALVSCPLYVEYKKKKEEYRVHVGTLPNGETTTIAVQRKARKNGFENPNWQVRNLAGGFIYQRQGFTLPSACGEVAHDCLRSAGLDFGAVDVIWNQHEQKAYVLEINTAPGLEGTTVQDYGKFFKEFE